MEIQLMQLLAPAILAGIPLFGIILSVNGHR